MVDDRIFDTPEDDYGALGLYDGEQNNELPFYSASPVSTSTSNERTRGTCCTCLNTTATHVFVPCGHLCICNDCKQQIKDQKCPLCREKFFQCMRVIMT